VWGHICLDRFIRRSEALCITTLDRARVDPSPLRISKGGLGAQVVVIGRGLAGVGGGSGRRRARHFGCGV